MVEFTSRKIPLAISAKSDNRIVLETLKFYESPIPPILNLENSKWNKLKAIEKKRKYKLFLGQTLNEIEEQFGSPNLGSDWKIKGMRIIKEFKNITMLDPSKPPKSILNLKKPISEPLFALSIIEKSKIELNKKT